MKNRILGAMMILNIFFLFAPFSSAKAVLLPFGGLVTYSLPCTCPTSLGRMLIWFTPFYFGLPAPSTGALTYIAGVSQLYSWFQIGVPGTWHLGNYIPDPSGIASCQMLLPPPAVGCVPFPTMGIITQVGTSKLF